MIHIAVGSNIDPEIHVPWAIGRLRDTMPVLAVSPFYRTAAINRPEQGDYWNGVVSVRHDGDGLRDVLRGIEAESGRVRNTDRWAARTLDLDILLHDGRAVDGDLDQRPFLARCLADLDALPEGVGAPAGTWTPVWREGTEA